MRAQLDISLDFDGVHNFSWVSSDSVDAIDVPKPTLERWTAEREAFKVARLRWQRVVEEIEGYLVDARGPSQPEHVVATVGAAVRAARRR